MRNARRGAHNAAHEISLPTSSFLPASVASYTYFLLAGLSYGARKHTQIRAQLPLAAGSHTERLFYERPVLGAPDPEYRVKSLLRQLRIRISPIRTPFRQAEDSQHVVRRAVISTVPKVTSTSTGSCAFQWVLPVPSESSRTAVQGNPASI